MIKSSENFKNLEKWKNSNYLNQLFKMKKLNVLWQISIEEIIDKVNYYFKYSFFWIRI